MQSDMRKAGLTMLLRLKNEEQWIGKCIESIQWADEIVCCLQNSTDRTEQILRDLGVTEIYKYPYDSRPNGPEHGNQPYDKYNRAYFYNWALSHTTRQYVVKWDGDMVAHDWLADAMIKAIADGLDLLAFKGVDLIQGPDGFYYRPDRPFCATEPRLFKVVRPHHWTTGAFCEKFVYERTATQNTLSQAAFLHFKWAKSLESATKAWPENWREVQHFQRILARSDLAGATKYAGKMPKCLSIP